MYYSFQDIVNLYFIMEFLPGGKKMDMSKNEWIYGRVMYGHIER